MYEQSEKEKKLLEAKIAAGIRGETGGLEIGTDENGNHNNVNNLMAMHDLNVVEVVWDFMLFKYYHNKNKCKHIEITFYHINDTF